MQSYWQTLNQCSYAPLIGEHHTDVAIVGGGYTGSWLGYWLKDAGLRVSIIEGQFPGFGASGRNGGLLLQGPAQLLSEASAMMGKAQALRLLDWTRRTFEWLQPLRARYDLDFHQTGSLYLGGDAGERSGIEETVSLFRDSGILARVLLPRDQPHSLQNLGYDVAAWFPDDGMVHPLKLIHALLNEAQQQGVGIYSQSRVERWDQDAKGHVLTGARFRVHASHVIIATNAYTPEWIPFFHNLIHPVRGQVLITEPVPPLDYSYPVYADHGFNYWHQRQEGMIVLGGFRHLAIEEEVGTDLVLHDRIQETLSEFMTKVAGRPIAITHRWAGIMGMTPDHLPYIGEIIKGLWIAGGYNGHGSTVAPIAAEMLKDAILEQKPIFPPFDVDRLRPS